METVVEGKKRPWWKNLKVLFAKKDKSLVIVHGYPKFVYVWPLVMAGVILGLTDGYGLMSTQTEGWLYLTILCSVILTLGIDMGRGATIAWALFVGLVWFAILWMRDVKHVVFFSEIYDYFANLNVTYSKDLGKVISIFGGIVYVGMIAWARLDCRWLFTSDDIEEWRFLRRAETFSRESIKISYDFSDILELFLLGAGSIVISPTQNTSGTELVRIDNVPGLFWRRNRINNLLQQINTDDVGDRVATVKPS